MKIETCGIQRIATAAEILIDELLHKRAQRLRLRMSSSLLWLCVIPRGPDHRQACIQRHFRCTLSDM